MLLMRQLFAYYFPQKCSFTLFEVVILVKILCTVNDNFRLIFVGVYHEIVALAADSCPASCIGLTSWRLLLTGWCTQWLDVCVSCGRSSTDGDF